MKLAQVVSKCENFGGEVNTFAGHHTLQVSVQKCQPFCRNACLFPCFGMLVLLGAPEKIPRGCLLWAEVI